MKEISSIKLLYIILENYIYHFNTFSERVAFIRYVFIKNNCKFSLLSKKLYNEENIIPQYRYKKIHLGKGVFYYLGLPKKSTEGCRKLIEFILKTKRV